MVYARIRELHGRRPFEPFHIRLLDGRVFTVDQPVFLMQSHNRRTVSYTTADDRSITIDVDQIVAVD